MMGFALLNLSYATQQLRALAALREASRTGAAGPRTPARLLSGTASVALVLVENVPGQKIGGLPPDGSLLGAHSAARRVLPWSKRWRCPTFRRAATIREPVEPSRGDRDVLTNGGTRGLSGLKDC